MGRRLITLTAALLGYATTIVAQGSSPAKPPGPGQDKPGPIRVAVEVVAVDVQVLDRAGQPVPNLGPDKFTVTINGRRRRVVSAEQIGRDAAEGTNGDQRRAAPPHRLRPRDHARGRLHQLRCHRIARSRSRASRSSSGDCRRTTMSACPPIPMARRLRPPLIMPRFFARSSTVVGQRDGAAPEPVPPPPDRNHRHLARHRLGHRSDARRCGHPGMRDRRTRPQLPGTAPQRGDQYRPLLRGPVDGEPRDAAHAHSTQMQSYPGRKTLVLVSGGMIASDTPGGRPDLGPSGLQVGKAAAVANTAIYTLFIDSTLHDQFAAETRTADEAPATAAAIPSSLRDGSSSSRARRAARSSPCSSATPRPRSSGFTGSCRPTICSGSNRRRRTGTAARTKSRSRSGSRTSRFAAGDG